MTQPLMEALKTTTRPSHDSAEGSRFQGLLANGRLPVALYVEYLGQLYLIHAKLEGELRRNASSLIGKGFCETEFQESYLRKDLEQFSANPEDLKPVEATLAMIKEIEELSARHPEALLGIHYVLLGSKHGGKLVAHNIKESYGLNGGAAGALYFDPYGSEFTNIWKQFKERMNNLDLTDEKVRATCDAAGATFCAIASIGEQLMANGAAG